MKIRKVLASILVLSLCGGTVLYADAAVQKVRTIINGSEIEDGGILAEGKAYLPLRQIGTSLQAIVDWDSQAKKATIYKPNVHMILFQDKVIFGNVEKGNRYTFNVFTQVDNLVPSITGLKVSIFDPNGNEKVISTTSDKISKDNFWYRTGDIKYNFELAGNYAVRFFMKVGPNDDWSLVSEKLIASQ